MFPINLSPLIFTLATAFGVVVHDMHIDRAAAAVVALPAIVASYGAYDAIDSLLKASNHTQIERAVFPKQLTALSSSIPRVQPRDDDRRYIQNKKLYASGADNGYMWPSV